MSRLLSGPAVARAPAPYVFSLPVGDTYEGLGYTLPAPDPLTGDASFNRSSYQDSYMENIYEARQDTYCFLVNRFIVNGTDVVPFTEYNRQVTCLLCYLHPKVSFIKLMSAFMSCG